MCPLISISLFSLSLSLSLFSLSLSFLSLSLSSFVASVVATFPGNSILERSLALSGPLDCAICRHHEIKFHLRPAQATGVVLFLRGDSTSLLIELSNRKLRLDVEQQDNDFLGRRIYASFGRMVDHQDFIFSFIRVHTVRERFLNISQLHRFGKPALRPPASLGWRISSHVRIPAAALLATEALQRLHSGFGNRRSAPVRRSKQERKGRLQGYSSVAATSLRNFM